MAGTRRVEEHWGTVITLDVRDDIAESAIDACFAWFGHVDDLFSTWRPDTEIMRYGRGALARDDLSRDVTEVLELCEGIRLESDGAFDIRVGSSANLDARPGRAPIDPSGLVKGWAVARASAMLRDAGAERYFVNAGGDLEAVGRPDDSPHGWRVGIQHPWRRDQVAVVLEISGSAVATSGRYERGDHVVDPRSGRPAAGLASVTVVGPDLAIADAYATAAMVLGPVDGMVWLAGRVGYEGLGITEARRVVTTSGFDKYRVT
jgi:thiamine biosynthesis lipoprotein